MVFEINQTHAVILVRGFAVRISTKLVKAFTKKFYSV